MSVLDAVLSVVSGGATGIIGAGIQTFAAYKTQQLQIQADAQKASHELSMVEAQAKVMAQEWSARTQVAQIEAQGAVDSEEAKAFTASMTSEPKRYAEGLAANGWQAGLMFLLDFFRGFVRPAMTFYLCALTTYVAVQSHNLLVEHGYSLTVEQALANDQRIVETVLYLTTTVTLWWFGTRPSKAGAKG